MQFILGGLLQTILTASFIVFYFSLEKQLQEQNLLTLSRLSAFLSVGTLKETKLERQTVKARADSIFMLKVIVWFMFATTVFNWVYSFMVFFMFNSDCYPQRISEFANSWFTLIDRIDSYFIWFYPILYLFWPTKKHIAQSKRIERVTVHSTHISVNFEQSDSSSDDDQDYGFC